MDRRTFLAGAAAACARGDSGIVDIEAGGKPVIAFHYSKWDKPFLYPIRTVSGKVISRGYPVEKRAGETEDHPWHRGIWYGHGDVNGEDFWREREKTSRLVVKAMPLVRRDGNRSVLTAEMSMITPAKKSIGTIRQEHSIEDRGRRRLIDSVITVIAVGGSLVFGDTDDGGFGFRLADEFREDRGAKLRNSEGQEGASKMWGKQARWVDYAAVIDGQPVGLALFDHPSNVRHPTRWHARNYSLCAANPFGTKSYTKDSSAEGSYKLPAGGQLVLRYRVVIHEGPFEPPEIESQYKDFAAK
jgi:hypothetical protein